MTRLMSSARPLIVSLLASAACTNADLYGLTGSGPGAPDRTAFEGLVCTPAATGDAFPVKVIYAIQGGDGVPPDFKGLIVDALSTPPQRPGMRFELIGFHTVATGLQGSFVDGTGLQAAAPRYSGYQEIGPISLRSPLKLAKSLISGDMQTGCRGTVARTRYVLFLIFLSSDRSCAYPTFNPGIDPQCNQFMPDETACST